MSNPKILYSVNTLLAYNINQSYYNGLHYVWCCPFFNTRVESFYNVRTPRSSIPSEIYIELLKDVRSNDLHSGKIKENRIGLLNGAVAKFEQGIITKEIKELIETIVSEATPADFLPLIYVIPFQSVKKLVENVPVKERASVLSSETRIRELPRRLFDIIDFDLV